MLAHVKAYNSSVFLILIADVCILLGLKFAHERQDAARKQARTKGDADHGVRNHRFARSRLQTSWIFSAWTGITRLLRSIKSGQSREGMPPSDFLSGLERKERGTLGCGHTWCRMKEAPRKSHTAK